MTDLPADKGYKYVPEDRSKRATRIADEIERLVGVSGLRVLDVGCHRGEIATALADRYGCEVIGVDIEAQPNWDELNQHPRIKVVEGDIAQPLSSLANESFDRIISISAWEHIRHPWSALQQCQRYLRIDGKFYLFSMLYRSAGASHLLHRIEERWPHLLFPPEEIRERLNVPKLGYAFWCNKLTYQQYLFYFRKLGFHVTFERFNQDMFDHKTFRQYEQRLELYPMWDLKTDFFKVVLEFDSAHPKQPIADMVYRLRHPSS
ncbi:class I SAM-dependent methyltransferase [Reyranella soli]|uniref:Methyltransferase type 11 domain-containing protein n=1 Tax=Reyranella soli TaxID=1230389 RepID=A0A512NI58_9HYPH|nr:class I SAM-dependent methyltransferase [Reyranella soli]GEP58616.1 hypothetical protein RSO01_57820 [Reyranella soli]